MRWHRVATSSSDLKEEGQKSKIHTNTIDTPFTALFNSAAPQSNATVACVLFQMATRPDFALDVTRVRREVWGRRLQTRFCAGCR